jgi:uncharacterized membrane protein YhhN
MKKTLVFTFVVLSIANLSGEIIHNATLIFWTKIFLMPLLLLLYTQYALQNTNKYIVLGLCCGFLGDVLLSGNPNIFFILGLTAFLLGHLFYAMAFITTIPSLFKIPVRFHLWLLSFIGSGLAMFLFLKPSLGSLSIPVAIYIGVIIAMSYAALTRYLYYRGFAFWLPFLGSISFLISDSILAIAKFKIELSLGGFFCMLTYLLAQILIVVGFLSSNRTKPDKTQVKC